MIRTAGFSRLEPHTEIAPHKGYTGDVLRFHLGIDIPDGDCALIVDGVTKKWKNGEILIFDDTFEHSAHNRTDHPRTVLLLDIYKRCFQ
jgi:beta-hydroxylase